MRGKADCCLVLCHAGLDTGTPCSIARSQTATCQLLSPPNQAEQPALTQLHASAGRGGAGGGDDTTIFVKGFDKYSQGEDDIRAALETHFGTVGTVLSVRLPSDRETGELKGIGFVQFDSAAGKVGQPACAASSHSWD